MSEASTFCHHCGGDLDHGKKHNHFRSFWEELMEMGLHFDHRNFRTLPILLLPGELPKLFCGESKARYTPPLKIYIFIALLFFGLVFAKQHKEGGKDQLDKIISLDLSEPGSEASKLVKDIEASKPEAEASKPEAKEMKFSVFSEDYWEKLGDSLDGEKKIDREQMQHRIEQFGFVSLILSFPLVSAWLLLLYRRTEHGFWQHMAFVLYTQTSIFALACIALGLQLLPYKALHVPGSWAFLGYIIFLYVALKRFYLGSWRKTLAKLGLLGIGYFSIVGSMVGLGFCAAVLWSLIQLGKS